MKKNTILIFFIAACFVLISFSTQNKSTGNANTYIVLLQQFDRLPVFNYGAKMAIVDASPWRPGMPKYSASTLFLSRCTDTTAHGGKVFELRVKDDNSYAYNATQPDSQLIIMACYNWKQGTGDLPHEPILRLTDSTYIQRTTPDKYYLMQKKPANTLGTDSGWIYAVVGINGKQVLQSGLVANCANCHRQSKTDRMFGAH